MPDRYIHITSDNDKFKCECGCDRWEVNTETKEKRCKNCHKPPPSADTVFNFPKDAFVEIQPVKPTR